jgi:hypothetical protein
VAVLLLGAGLAGCASDTGPADGNEGTTDDGGTGTGAADARSTFASAVSGFEKGSSDAERVAMEMTVEKEDGSNGSMTALFVAEKSLSLWQMDEGFTEDSGQGAGPQLDTMTIAQVHKTAFVGGEDSLIGFYNESETPPDTFSFFDESLLSSGNGGSSADVTNPEDLVGGLENATDEAEFESTETTFQGQSAREIQASWENETGAYSARVVVDTETDRTLLIEGQGPGDGGPGTYRMTFTYGGEATHPMEETVYRAETMTFSEGEPQPFQGGGDGSDAYTNRTIQPSQNPGTIGLEELEVLAVPSSSDTSSGETTPPALRLSAEEGTAEDEDAAVRLTYEDADDDGAVTPEDRIMLEDLNTSDDQDYSLELHDEETGLRLAPGPGLLAGLAVLGIGALATRRRR